MIYTVGLLFLIQLARISAESLIFSEDWSKGIDFGKWKHELVRISDFFFFHIASY